MKCGEEYNPTILMHLVFGNQHFEPIEKIISSSLLSENLKTKWETNFNNNIPILKKNRSIILWVNFRERTNNLQPEFFKSLHFV